MPANQPKVASCGTCHKEKIQEFQQKEFRHASVATGGDCRYCHLSHGVANKLALVKEKADLCYSCHPQKKTEYETGSVHYPVEKGDCTKCHDPHASSNKNFLSKTGQELCLTCHLENQAMLTNDKDVHQPFGDGNCSQCHEPHATAERT